jgi:diguanylate cyclase (GGDEF)-like protein
VVIAAAWTALGVLMASYVYVYYTPGGLGHAWSEWLVQLVYLVPYLTTVLLCLVLALRQPPGRERRFWGYLGFSSLLLLTYESLFAYRVLAGLPEDWWGFQAGAVFPLVAALIFVVALSMLSRLGTSTLLSRIRVLADVVIEYYLVVLVLLALVLEPMMDLGGASLQTMLFAAASSAAGLVILAWCVMEAAGFKSTPWERWERVVVSGLAIYAVGAALWPVYWMATTVFHDTSLAQAVALMWMLGQGVTSMGALYRLVDGGSGDLGFKSDPSAYDPPPRPWTIPAAAIAGLMVVALWSAAGPEDSVMRPVVVISIPVLGALLAFRSLLLVWEAERRVARSSVDPVSGSPTLTEFDAVLHRNLELAGRFAEPLALVVVDVDRFGEINDAHGHQLGDRTLALIGATLREATQRDGMYSCRIGSDEFAVMIPGADGVAAFKAALRLQMQLEHAAAHAEVPFAASIGFAVFPEHGPDATVLMRAARDALDAAKTGDQGHVVAYDPEDAGLRRLGDADAAGSYLESMRVLARSVENRAPHSVGHGSAVAALAVMLARQLRLDEERVRLLEIAGELHDIGFISVSDAVLEKPGKLDAAERRLVEGHPEMGARLLTSLGIAEIPPWVRAHHERWDGRGYPRSLAGGEIPLGARILAVCDAFASMTAERPYRRALRRDEAIEQLGQGRGSQFDPAIVDEFFFVLSSTAGRGVGNEA